MLKKYNVKKYLPFEYVGLFHLLIFVHLPFKLFYSNIFSSGDEKSREFEKKKIQIDLKKADEKLGTLVEGNFRFSFLIVYMLSVSEVYMALCDIFVLYP